MALRLFVALRPPAATRAVLLGLAGDIAYARWQNDAQLHCTLRFIGEVDRHSAKDIDAALAGIAHRPVTLSLDAAGTFDRRGRVDALWIGLRPAHALEVLHRKVERALIAVGIPADARSFVPHVTLARFARSESPPPTIAAGLRVPIGVSFEATHLELMQSHLGTDGSVYETIARYPFA